jgi:hypothetical protein
LSVLSYRTIPFQKDDILFTLTKTYENRPDLLAYELYNSSNLWWIFAARNPTIIKDPIFDFVAGTPIYLPKLSTLKKYLGI